ncbi:class I SAM-dependent methyltransferase [Brevibacterium sp. FME17]|uniref:class I SAM-dependent methyltransferase n=1 Tax=Brevibacterium sp. FME17 TaxID=2742606 RepID=UPI001866B90B|nr:class I SAM-dependent methyltransferase [Brevibacterium sp. FME17]
MSDDTTASERFWEPQYQGSRPSLGARPNPAFADVVDDLRLVPARALELGCGHGGDALWLASNGWQVTAVDVSATAVARVNDAGQHSGLGASLTAVQQDLTLDLPTGVFDLVYACYFHTPVEIGRDAIIGRASDLVSSKGFLIVIDHASAAPWSWGHPDQQFPTAHETLTRFGLGEDLRLVREETTWREASGPAGQRAAVAENIIITQRL